MNELKMIEHKPNMDYLKLNVPLPFLFNSHSKQALPIVSLHPSFILTINNGINIKPARKKFK